MVASLNALNPAWLMRYPRLILLRNNWYLGNWTSMATDDKNWTWRIFWSPFWVSGTLGLGDQWFNTLTPLVMRDAWINPERIEGFWVDRKIRQGIRFYDILRIILGWPHYHYQYPRECVLAKTMSWRIFSFLAMNCYVWLCILWLCIGILFKFKMTRYKRFSSINGRPAQYSSSIWESQLRPRWRYRYILWPLKFKIQCMLWHVELCPHQLL